MENKLNPNLPSFVPLSGPNMKMFESAFDKNFINSGPSNKIAIPSRSYDIKKFESSNNRAEDLIAGADFVANLDHKVDDCGPQEDSDPWNNIDEQPKFSYNQSLKVDPWEAKEEEQEKNLVIKSEVKIESKIKIPENPYKSKNPNEAPKLPAEIQRNNYQFKKKNTNKKDEIAIKNTVVNPSTSYLNPSKASLNLLSPSLNPSNPPINQSNPPIKIRNFSPGSLSIPINSSQVYPNEISNPLPNSQETWPSFLKDSIESVIIEDFNLKTHKTQPCQLGAKCKGCNRYHYEGEKRRDLEKIQYAPVLCTRAGNCLQKDRCGKAHNFMEIYYHPQIYRSHQCPYTIKFKQCALGQYCNFIHLFDEVVVNTKAKCNHCKLEEVTLARVKCGHTFCKNCGVGEECKKCKMPGDVIKIEL
jgi:hypothetical protein